MRGLIFGLLFVAFASIGCLAETAPTIEGTSWAYRDDQHRFRKVTFESGGTASITYLEVGSNVTLNDGLGLMHPVYMVKQKKGPWSQQDKKVLFSFVDESVTDLPAGTHPSDVYEATMDGAEMHGTFKASYGSQWTWQATRILETENRVPQILVADEPVYSEENTFFGTKPRPGSVTVRIKIDADGNVVDVTVLNATKKYYSEPARQAVSSWKFLPRLKTGRPVPATLELAVNFKGGTAPHP